MGTEWCALAEPATSCWDKFTHPLRPGDGRVRGRGGGRVRGRLRTRGHEDEERSAGAGAVLDAVLAAGRAERHFAGAEVPRLGSDADLHRALQDPVQLVAPGVRVRLLLLPGLQAVDVTEEALRFEQVQLLQLVGGEAAQEREALDVNHCRPSSWPGRTSAGSWRRWRRPGPWARTH